MVAVLQHKSRRTSFLLIVSAVILIIFLLRLYVIPTHFPNQSAPSSYLISFLDNVSISLIGSVLLALFLFKIEIPEEEKKHEIVEAGRLKEIFARAHLQSNFWFFSGGTGRYTRSVTIPTMSKTSQDLNESRVIKLILLDPFDLTACDKYAKFRNGLRSGKDSKLTWTKEYVRNEILATISAAVLHKSKNPLLEITIFLKPNFSTMRLDLNQLNCLVTKEDKKEPALLSPSSTFLYRTYKEEIFHLSKQCKELEIKSIYLNKSYADVSPVDIKQILSGTNIEVSEDDFDRIAKILNENENPYG